MSKFITAIFGASFVGSVFALRTYLGIALVLMVSTCTFKADIVSYIKDSNAQAHQERLAQINFETERLKIEAIEKVRIATEEKAKQEEADREAQKNQTKKEKQRQKDLAQAEIEQSIQIAKNEIDRTKGYNVIFWNQYRASDPADKITRDRIVASIVQNEQWIKHQDTLISDLQVKLRNLNKG